MAENISDDLKDTVQSLTDLIIALVFAVLILGIANSGLRAIQQVENAETEENKASDDGKSVDAPSESEGDSLVKPEPENIAPLADIQKQNLNQSVQTLNQSLTSINSAATLQ